MNKVHSRMQELIGQQTERVECKFCGQLFETNQMLLDHIKIHKKENPFCCSLCGKGLKHQASYDRHMQTHSDVKQFKCKHCSYSFNQKVQIKRHMEVHHGVTNCVMDECLVRLQQPNSAQEPEKLSILQEPNPVVETGKL